MTMTCIGRHPSAGMKSAMQASIGLFAGHGLTNRPRCPRPPRGVRHTLFQQLDHPAIRPLSAVAPATLAQCAACTDALVASIYQGTFLVSPLSLAEQFTGMHLHEMLSIPVRLYHQLARLSAVPDQFPALFKIAMALSDLGKLHPFATLLTEPSALSDLLLGVLQGADRTDPTTRVLGRTVQEMGFAHAWILPPGLSRDEMRAVFRAAPGLVTYLHELPGLAYAILMHTTGSIDDSQFQAIVTGVLLHNGPQQGFWQFFTEVVIPDLLRQAATTTQAARFFQGTLYAAGHKRDGIWVPQYPGPRGFIALLHTLLDRLSQGTQGGTVKIFCELLEAKTLHPVRIVQELVLQNPGKTVRQLRALGRHVSYEAVAGRLRPTQAQAVLQLTAQATLLVQAFARQVQSAIQVHVAEDETTLRIGPRCFATTQAAEDVGLAIFAELNTLFAGFQDPFQRLAL